MPRNGERPVLKYDELYRRLTPGERTCHPSEAEFIKIASRKEKYDHLNFNNLVRFGFLQYGNEKIINEFAVKLVKSRVGEDIRKEFKEIEYDLSEIFPSFNPAQEALKLRTLKKNVKNIALSYLTLGGFALHKAYSLAKTKSNFISENKLTKGNCGVAVEAFKNAIVGLQGGHAQKYKVREAKDLRKTYDNDSRYNPFRVQLRRAAVAAVNVVLCGAVAAADFDRQITQFKNAQRKENDPRFSFIGPFEKRGAARSETGITTSHDKKGPPPAVGQANATTSRDKKRQSPAVSQANVTTSRDNDRKGPPPGVVEVNSDDRQVSRTARTAMCRTNGLEAASDLKGMIHRTAQSKSEHKTSYRQLSMNRQQGGGRSSKIAPVISRDEKAELTAITNLPLPKKSFAGSLGAPKAGTFSDRTKSQSGLKSVRVPVAC